MLLQIHPENPQERYLQTVVETLQNGGVIIYPTDTMYALGCDITKKKAVEKICRIKGIDPKKSHLTCVCEDLAILGQYTNRVDTNTFKMMKRAFPGPYVFILEASKNIPRHFRHKDTVGIRIAGNPISQRLVELLGNPIASISLPYDDEIPENNINPELIHERFSHEVDLVIDGGIGNMQPSTVIDASEGDNAVTLIREGAGDLEKIGLVVE
jgi:tRNA threonylcarbamoyl adenosine modification protein (Sua5/YciO/YrdC/YwlC family)